MPYVCAKAVCATFCHKIAGALIPIFGPSFPSLCTPPDSPSYGRMSIDPSIIADATREAERNLCRQLALHVPRPGGLPASHSPRGRRTLARSTPERDPFLTSRTLFQPPQARLGLHARPVGTSPYNTDSDDGYRSVPDAAAGTYMYAPAPAPARTSGWTPANVSPVRRVLEPEPQSWAATVPRFAPPGSDPRLRPWKGHRGKRFVDEGEDCGYEGGAESQSNSPSMGSEAGAKWKAPNTEEAQLLLNLRERERSGEGLHRAKRQRASSM